MTNVKILVEKLYTARIICDSIAPCGKRLTTMVVRIPKFVQAELNTHRMLSRNSASSRAIPIEKMIKRIQEEPAESMREAMAESKPEKLEEGGWHLPFVDPTLNDEPDGLDTQAEWRLISAARCARVSYLTHEGERDCSEDLKLAERLIASGHWSPFEHVAMAMYGRPEDLSPAMRCANFIGWHQLRADLDKENF